MPTVFITGANRGLGYEFAHQYAGEGWDVIACCRSPEKAAELQNLSKGNPKVRIEKLDVTDDIEITALANKLEGTSIDLLLNCAGILSGARPGATAADADETQRLGFIDSEGWMKVFRTNSIAPIKVAEAFWKNLAKGKDRKLVNITSRMGSIERIRRPGDIAYRTSKAALNAATKSISFDLRAEGITVVCFHPGWVKTDMGGEDADLTPEQSVGSMRSVIANLKLEDTGKFFDYDGELLPW